MSAGTPQLDKEIDKLKKKTKESKRHRVSFHNGMRVNIEGVQFKIQVIGKRFIRLQPLNPEVKDLRTTTFLVEEGERK